jgi:hypothetical protein
MRTIVDLPQEALDKLAKVCARERISRAEALRRAVAAFLREKGAETENDAFGLWRSRHGDGLAYQDRIRDEWQGHARGRRHQHPG